MTQYFAHESLETHVHTSGQEASSAIYIGAIALVVIATIAVLAISMLRKNSSNKAEKSAQDK